MQIDDKTNIPAPAPFGEIAIGGGFVHLGTPYVKKDADNALDLGTLALVPFTVQMVEPRKFVVVMTLP